ncbi:MULTISPECIES: PA2779 family protein [Halomonadaceae]|uniref:PA2779 family protein n=1 Tax=Halomonas TaxID=2745 RepID=UPI0018A7B516|nr:PA2779 family protein [Halomonas sp. 328]MBF8223628.1 PA2779 family protein [Halomonas sp. 328]
MKTVARVLSPLLILCLVLGSLPVAAAPSPATGLISTQEALSQDQVSADRERISEILARQEVQDQLVAQGVDPAEVEARVAALSDAEVRQMADQLEQLPAGASVIGVLFAVFVILLVTDILGLTNAFPFTR